MKVYIKMKNGREMIFSNAKDVQVDKDIFGTECLEFVEPVNNSTITIELSAIEKYEIEKE